MNKAKPIESMLPMLSSETTSIKVRTLGSSFKAGLAEVCHTSALLFLLPKLEKVSAFNG